MCRAILIVAMSATVASTVTAGPLNPPAGPVASTGRFGPRIEINQTNTPGDFDSLYHIGEGGSYYLAADVLMRSGDHGIEIQASGVTIDLNGYTIRKGLLQTGTLDGIFVFAGHENIVIRNGIIRGASGDGIDLAGARGCQIENVSVRSCGGVGIRAGADVRIESCTSAENSGTGFVTSSNCVLDSCIAELNGGIGIQLSFGCIARDCAANANSLSGFASGQGTTLIGCAALGNGTVGFSVAGGSRASDCTAYLNASNGFSGSSGSQFDSCTARNNGNAGFALGDGCMVTGSLSYDNSLHGFLVTGNECHIVGNAATSNGATGFQVNGNSAWIDGNTARGNNHGVFFSGCNNWAVRNFVIQNATDSFGSDAECNILSINKLAPTEILPFDPAISPWANFDDVP